MENLIGRLRTLWMLMGVTKNLKYTKKVANRTIFSGKTSQDIETTIIFTDLTKEEGYTREELLEMLKLIRIHEEKQLWKVPEPVRCIYCNHCTPVDSNGFCPVELDVKRCSLTRLLSLPCPKIR